jgi:hypothetical protein
MSYEIRQGPARELIVDGNELDPAEGSELSYTLSGRSGAIHMSGNSNFYGESNPHPGGFKQDVSLNADMYKKLKAIQTAGRFVSVSITTAGNEVLVGQMGISTDGGLEMANGIVSLEMAGKLDIV